MISMLCCCRVVAGRNESLAMRVEALQAEKDQLDVCIAQLSKYIKATDNSHMKTKVNI